MSKTSTISPEFTTLPEKIPRAEMVTISSSSEEVKQPFQALRSKSPVTAATVTSPPINISTVKSQPPTTPVKSPPTTPKQTMPEYIATSAKFWKPSKVPKPEKAILESPQQVEEEIPTTLPPEIKQKTKMPPPTPPKPSSGKTTPSPKPKQVVFSESEDEFVRKELTFETPTKRKEPIPPSCVSPPSKIPIYSPPPPPSTPSKFIPITESPLPSSGVEDDGPPPPAVWKPGREQVVTTTWRPVKPPPATPVKSLISQEVTPPAPSEFETPSPVSLFKKSVHITEETTTIKKETRTLTPSKLTSLTLSEIPKQPSPPMPEPGPPPEFGYVDPKSVPRQPRTVVPPKPPTPTSMPKGGVPVYPGMPDAGCYTPPIGASAHAPVFPKIATQVKPVPIKPGTPPEEGYISPIKTTSHVSEDKTDITTTTFASSFRSPASSLFQPQTTPAPPLSSSIPLEPCKSPEIGFLPPTSKPQSPLPTVPSKIDIIPVVWHARIDKSSAPVFVKVTQFYFKKI